MSDMVREIVLHIPKKDDLRLRGVYVNFCQGQAAANGSGVPSYGEFLYGLIDMGLRGLVNEVLAEKLAKDGVEPPAPPAEGGDA